MPPTRILIIDQQFAWPQFPKLEAHGRQRPGVGSRRPARGARHQPAEGWHRQQPDQLKNEVRRAENPEHRNHGNFRRRTGTSPEPATAKWCQCRVAGYSRTSAARLRTWRLESSEGLIEPGRTDRIRQEENRSVRLASPPGTETERKSSSCPGPRGPA